MCDKVKRLIRDLRREKAELIRRREARVEDWIRAHIDAEKLRAREMQIDQALNRLSSQV